MAAERRATRMRRYPWNFGWSSSGLPAGLRQASGEDAEMLARFLAARDGRLALRGAAVVLDEDGERTASSTLFRLGRADPSLEGLPVGDEGRLVVKSGEVLVATGQRFYALLTLDAADDYDHWDTHFVFPDRLSPDGYAVVPESDHFGLETEWGRMRALEDGCSGMEMYPHTYRYFDAGVRRRDPHVDGSGWCADGPEVAGRVLTLAREIRAAWREARGETGAGPTEAASGGSDRPPGYLAPDPLPARKGKRAHRNAERRGGRRPR